ncbi:MAG: sulfurtransferase TusA [Pseudomonadota bacterium]|nr:sulfurtransferase TusA [Pseudomonadota bacterium]
MANIGPQANDDELVFIDTSPPIQRARRYAQLLCTDAMACWLSRIQLRSSIVTDIDHEIDTRGLFCPEPLMLVRNKIREMTSGETIRIEATDPSTKRDFTNFCRFLGHQLVQCSKNGDIFEYVIKKG